MKIIFLVFIIGISLFADKYSRIALKDAWTFEYEVREVPATGLLKHKSERPSNHIFFEEPTPMPKKFHLSQLAELSPIMNQGNCGSCVYNSVIKNLEDSLRIKGIKVDRLSRQFVMDCGSGWSCNGSYFSKVAESLKVLGGTPLEKDYPYKAKNQKCSKDKPLHVGIAGWKIINNSPKSIIEALNSGYPVSVTVAANGSWASYKSGVYNACNSNSTNHQVLIVGYDCETSVDKDGHCKFDANGKLPNGVGLWNVHNSWGESWGEKGAMVSKMTSRKGGKCNALAGEAGILETVVLD